MKRMDPTVKKETFYIAAWTLVFSALMQFVFLVCGAWGYSVFWGNLFGGVAAVGNFFLLGLTVQSALEKEEAEAKVLLRRSQTLRFFSLFLVAAMGYFVPVFHPVAAILPLLFPRLAIVFRPLFMKKQGPNE